MGKPRTALVGYTGFVGSNLLRAHNFDGRFNSKTASELAGETFEVLVCAGAPATMWAANSNPAADAANLDRLFNALASATIDRLVLISTVAVFDDPAAGYSEADAKYETTKAYGSHRRLLETRVLDAFPKAHVVRLPALFGLGLKKNFIFDLMNPVPSFIKPDKFEKTLAAFEPVEQAMLERAFRFDEGLKMWAFQREPFARDPDGPALAAAFGRIGFIARNFTNSASRYQYYDVTRLWDDISTCVVHDIEALNICSEPLAAADVHEHLFGAPFHNDGPPIVAEDVRTDFAGAFGRSGPYLFRREEVLRGLEAFVLGVGA